MSNTPEIMQVIVRQNIVIAENAPTIEIMHPTKLRIRVIVNSLYLLELLFAFSRF